MERTNREFQEEMEYAMEREAHRREEMQKQRERWKNKKNGEQKKKEKERKAMELKQQGLTERQIAKKMKIGNASVHRLLVQSRADGE